jgi:hypothetical protein
MSHYQLYPSGVNEPHIPVSHREDEYDQTAFDTQSEPDKKVKAA